MKKLTILILILMMGCAQDKKEESKKTEEMEAKKLFIYHLQLEAKYKKEENWTDESYKIIQEHADYLEELGKNGTLILAGRTELTFDDEDLFGIAIIKAASLEEARELLGKDPAVLNGIQKCKILPWRMSIEYLENYGE